MRRSALWHETCIVGRSDPGWRCPVRPMSGAVLQDYDPGSAWCEMLRSEAARPTRERLAALSVETLRRRAADAEAELFNLGITFTVYAENQAIDRILPFDVIPRVIAADEWQHIESGLVQRVTALNRLLHDIYHEQKIVRDRVLPADLVLGHPCYRPVMRGIEPPHGTYIHICGIDIIRDQDGRFLVLEDNGRTPSGVSYVIENRNLMQRTFPDLLDRIAVRRVDNYGLRLADALREVAPPDAANPGIVLLSPGIYNSAYFEHVFLAREMGVSLVEGRDLFVADDRLFMRTTAGPSPVHVVYRRINDDFLDPEAFRPESMLGVPGIMRACRAGNVTLANAVGTGVADDKAVYAYMPRIIRYYLDEDAILANVETYLCREPAGLRYTLDHLSRLVVKPVGEAGGYGITIGPQASRAELEECRARLIADPANYISQPCITLSVSPTLVEDGVAPRHVDLRPFAITGKNTWVLPGGLTRVALRAGSLVVNSSQGGGSKDTWVLE